MGSDEINATAFLQRIETSNLITSIGKLRQERAFDQAGLAFSRRDCVLVYFQIDRDFHSAEVDVEISFQGRSAASHH